MSMCKHFGKILTIIIGDVAGLASGAGCVRARCICTETHLGHVLAGIDAGARRRLVLLPLDCMGRFHVAPSWSDVVSGCHRLQSLGSTRGERTEPESSTEGARFLLTPVMGIVWVW